MTDPVINPLNITLPDDLLMFYRRVHSKIITKYIESSLSPGLFFQAQTLYMDGNELNG